MPAPQTGTAHTAGGQTAEIRPATRPPHVEGRIPFAGYSTWYRIYGDRNESGKLPLLCIHGGPGGSSRDLLPLRAIAETGRRVILYDQLGGGHSSLPEPHPELWTVDLFVREVDAVRQALGLERVHLFGHSWGGVVALTYTLTRPRGVASLTLASTMASFPQFVCETYRLLDELSPAFGTLVREHEAAGTCDDPAYLEACQAWYDCYIAPRHPESVPHDEDEAEFSGSHEVYRALNGPLEFDVQGPIREWDVTDRLAEIAVPTLVTSGRFDVMTEPIVRVLHEGIRGSEWVVFEDSAHLAHVDETDRYLAVLDGFLSRHEA